MFYNTTNETNPELSEYRAKAMKQDDVILELFKIGYASGHTPSEVMQTVLPNVPITSVRRSITNLTDAKKLVKTEYKRKGLYGRNEHVWTLKQAKQMELL